MPLKNDVETLRDSTVDSLAAAHDHFAYTCDVWRIVHLDVRRRGRKIQFKNEVTKSRLAEKDLLLVAQASINDYLPVATIQQLVSLTEIFLMDLVKMWLDSYPAHLKGQVDVQTIIAARDKAEIVQSLIDQHVLSMAYKRPAEWFKQLHGIISIKSPSDIEIEQFAEFKATRDVFVHNRGIASSTYVDKAGKAARQSTGQRLNLPRSYINDGWRLCRKLVHDVGTQAAAKA